MKNVRTLSFKKLFSELPKSVQETAAMRYEKYFLLDPFHPLLERHFLGDVSDAPRKSFAVTLASGYRAVAFFDESADCNVWYWCGSHANYDVKYRKGR